MSTAAGSPARATVFRLGTPGYASCLLFSIAVVVVARGWWIGLAFALVLLLAVAQNRTAVARLAHNRLLIWFLLLTALLGGLFGPQPVDLGGLSVSLTGLWLGLQIALRAATVMLGIALFSTSVSVIELTGLLERLGLKGLGFATGVALNMLPTAYQNVATSYYALRLRGGFRRSPLRSARLLLTTVVVNCLRHADDIVDAAEARAFSTERIRPLPVSWQPGDRVVAAVLLAAVVVLALL